MAYLGAVAVTLAMYLVWREYSHFLDGQLAWCRCFLRALGDYRNKMKCYMDTPTKWAGEYSDGHLSSCGFLERLEKEGNFKSAYTSACPSAHMSDSTDEILSSCFQRLGDGYLDTELEALSVAIDGLTREEARLSENVYKKRRASGAMLGAFAMGIVILII